MKVSSRTILCHDECFDVTVGGVRTASHCCYANTKLGRFSPYHLREVANGFSILASSSVVVIVIDLNVPLENKRQIYLTTVCQWLALEMRFLILLLYSKLHVAIFTQE